jgi:hypothetical protein
MWSEIASRIPSVSEASDLEVRRSKRSRWFLPASLAAALVLGIGIDRVLSSRQQAADSGQQQIKPQTVATTVDSASPNKLYRLAAQQTLSQAEALLTAYRADEARQHNPESARQLSQWGRQVLGSTRLLIDSPAGDDPRLKPLLEDLEVVLVQIIRLSGEPLDASERALIDGAITNRHLLPRIRSAVPAGSGDVSTD